MRALLIAIKVLLVQIVTSLLDVATRKFGLDPLKPKFHPGNLVTKLPLVGGVAATELTISDVEKENNFVMLPEVI